LRELGGGLGRKIGAGEGNQCAGGSQKIPIKEGEIPQKERSGGVTVKKTRTPAKEGKNRTVKSWPRKKGKVS